MHKTWIVFKQELLNTLTRRSFLITLFLIPLIPAILVAILGSLGEEKKTQVIQDVFSPQANTFVSEGYVDNANVIKSLPDWVDMSRLVPYPSEESARNDLTNGIITAYYLIPTDYLELGEVSYVRADFNPMAGFDQSNLMEEVLRFNLLGGEGDLYGKYQNPVNFQMANLQPEVEERDQSSMLSFYLPYGVTMLFYFVVITSSSLMLNSITKEKENRVVEILMSSLKPIQLFTGKILALGIVGLIQMVVWLGSALLIMRFGGNTLNIPSNLQIPLSLLYWSIIYFLLGYGLYGSLMAGIGAMVPNLREASQATFIVIVPIIIPLFLISSTITNPNGLAAVIISMIPLTAPVGMMTRLAAGGIPLWQPIVSAILLLGTVILIIRGVAKLFQTQTLLTGQKFSTKAFVKGLFSKASQ